MTTTELAAMTLPKLKEVASQLGIEGAAKLKKDALVTAIGDLQAANREAAKAEREARREARNAKRNNKKSDDAEDSEDSSTENSNGSNDDENSSDNSSDNRGDRGDRFDRNDRNRNRRDRNRDRNGRNRDRNDRGGREDREPVIGEDDVLVPVGGLVDILENYSFIRTAGYLPGPNDVYVSQGQVRKYGLRKGDVVTGQVRQAREGEQKQKYNPLITLETVNGVPVEDAKARVEFGKLTPLYP